MKCIHVARHKAQYIYSPVVFATNKEATKLFCCICFMPAFHCVKLSSLITGYNKMLDKMITKRWQYFSECDDDLRPGV